MSLSSVTSQLALRALIFTEGEKWSSKSDMAKANSTVDVFLSEKGGHPSGMG